MKLFWKTIVTVKINYDSVFGSDSTFWARPPKCRSYSEAHSNNCEIRFLQKFRFSILCYSSTYRWRWVLDYNISVIMFKVLIHLVGCLILNYFQWHSCLFMRAVSMFCPRQISGELQSKFWLSFSFFFFNFPNDRSVTIVVIKSETCGVSKDETGLFWDALTFTLLLFQRRFFESGHFFRLIDDTKAVAVLASKMGSLINEWSRKKKDESRQTDLESLEKIKKKLNKLRNLKEHRAKKQQTHFTGVICSRLSLYISWQFVGV